MRKLSIVLIMLAVVLAPAMAEVATALGVPAPTFLDQFTGQLKSWIVNNLPTLLGWFFYGVFALFGSAAVFGVFRKAQGFLTGRADALIEKFPAYKETIDLVKTLLDEEVDALQDQVEELKKKSADHHLSQAEIDELHRKAIDNAIARAKPYLSKIGYQILIDSKEHFTSELISRIKIRVFNNKKKLALNTVPLTGSGTK